MSENGTVARCDYRNSSGKLTKEVLYRSDGSFVPPFLISELIADTIREFMYDGKGRRVRSETYSADHELLSYSQTEHMSGGVRVLSTFSAVGTKMWETWRRESDSATVIRFDDEGTRPIAIRGPLLNARDLPEGWGRSVDGISCGVAPSGSSGLAREIRVYASLRNLSDRTLEVPTQGTHYLRLELRDADKRLTSQKDEYLALRTAQLARDMQDPASFGYRLVEPNHAEYWGGDFGLHDVYGDLASGIYTLSVARVVPELANPIVCNTLTITVTANDSMAGGVR